MKSKTWPHISVIMPNYNGENYIKFAIKSVLKQTYTNFELIIIDDGSLDSSWEIIEKYAKKDKRIKPIKNNKNLKIVKTRNKGFKLVSKKSKYVAILDSDDIALPKRLEKEIDFLEKNPKYSVVGSNIKIINEKNKIVGKRKYLDNASETIYIKNPLAQSSVMIRKEILNKVGNYNKNYEVCEDWDLWFRILKISKIKLLDNYLIQYRISSNQSKSKKLKLTIINSIKIKLKYIRKNKNYKLKYFFRIALELFTLILPNKVIIFLFKKMEYENE